MKLDLKNTLSKLPQQVNGDYVHGLPFVQLLQRNGVSVELFYPASSGLGKDIQKPHRQDELYFVAAGLAVLLLTGERHSVQAGDALFVPAGAEHSFIEFSQDFAVWVVFFGEVHA